MADDSLSDVDKARIAVDRAKLSLDECSNRIMRLSSALSNAYRDQIETQRNLRNYIANYDALALRESATTLPYHRTTM